jgi:hypothetical protein
MLRFASNPGVGALMLVNPSNQPTQGELLPMSKGETKSKAKRSGKGKQAGAASEAKASPRPPAAEPAAKAAASKPKASPKAKKATPKLPSYEELLAHEHVSQAKDPQRGLKALWNDWRSLRWNARFGTEAARNWLHEHVPALNPDETVKSVGFGVMSYIGSRILSNLAARLPLLNRLGPHGPVLTSAALGGLAYFLVRNKPELRLPVLLGAGIGVIDAVLRNYVPAYLPAASGILGEAPSLPEMESYEPVGYLPEESELADFGELADCGCVPEGQAGFDVREALADAGDGIGYEVSEAQAGMDGYIPDPAMSDYVPTNGVSGMDDYSDEEAIGSWRSFVGHGGRGGHGGHPGRGRQPVRTRPLMLRRQGQQGPEYVYVNVICPHTAQRRHARSAYPRPQGHARRMPQAASHPTVTQVVPAPEPVRALPVAPAVSGMADAPGGIFAGGE